MSHHTDTNDIAGQLARRIAYEVDCNIARWIAPHVSFPLDDATVDRVCEIRAANLPAFWESIAPAVIDSYIQAYDEALTVLRDSKRRMEKASRKGRRVMDFFLGSLASLYGVPPAPAPAAVVAESPAPIVHVHPQIELKPEITVNIPATKEIKFIRDPQRNQIMSAEVVKA